MNLEQRFLPEVARKIAVVDEHRDYLLEQGILQGDKTFVKTLGNFYGVDGSWHRVNKPYEEEKLGKVPEDLLTVLQEFSGKRKKLPTYAPYDAIHNSFVNYTMPPFQGVWNAGLAVLGMATAIIGVFLPLADVTEPEVGGSIALGGFVISAASIYFLTRDPRPEELQKQQADMRETFRSLTGAASNADRFIRDYTAFFESNHA